MTRLRPIGDDRSPIDPTRPDRFSEMTRPPAASEWTRRVLDGWQDPNLIHADAPTRMEIERETGVAFFRGALNTLAFSALLAALLGLYLIAG